VVGVRMEDADNIQSKPFGFELAAQDVLRLHQVAVVASTIFTGVLDGQKFEYLASVAIHPPQHETSAFFRVGSLAMLVDAGQQD
jgi:hypothetical protein